MDETKQVTTTEPAGKLTMPFDPDNILAQDELLAKRLMVMVKKTGSSVMISGREHLKIEAWLTLAKWCDVTVQCLKSNPITLEDGSKGWEADAVTVRESTGRELTRAQAMCMEDEPNWGTRPKYVYDEKTKQRVKVGEEKVSHNHRRSMAKTRACAAALALKLRAIVVLAKYATTPAEEMEGLGENGAPPQEPAMPQPGLGTLRGPAPLAP